jgi:hypothetical protein
LLHRALTACSKDPFKMLPNASGTTRLPLLIINMLLMLAG